MAVDLTRPVRTANIRLMDFGGFLAPSLGGFVQRFERLGNRHALDVEFPPIPEEPDGRIFTALLEQALSEGALFAFPQTGFLIRPSGTPLVDGAVASGSSLPIKGLLAGYAIRAGQYISVISSGRRYLYRSKTQVIADGSGDATVSIMPLLRESLADNDVVEIEKPFIEGWVQAPDWGLMLEPFASIRISITEAG